MNRNAVDTRLSSSPTHLINREPGYEARLQLSKPPCTTISQVYDYWNVYGRSLWLEGPSQINVQDPVLRRAYKMQSYCNSDT